MLVRERRSGDVAACIDIMFRTHEATAYPVYWPADPRGFLVGNAELAAWVACDDGGTIVGHVAIHHAADDPAFDPVQLATSRPPEEFSVVARLMVDPRSQTSGTGRALLDVAVAASQKLGRHPVLDVVEGSTRAIAFYEALGWERVGSVEIDVGDRPSLSAWIYTLPGLAGY